MRWWVAFAIVVGCKGEPKAPTKDMVMSTCADSTEATCAGSGGRWTGGKCCVDVETCADGTEAACVRGGGAWHDAQCCLPARWSCTGGPETECTRGGGTWTGAMCCRR